jgi:hypothetical protein
MSRLTTSIAQIRELGPCATGYRLALTGLPKDGEVTAAEARAAGVKLDDVAWYLSIQAQHDAEIRRRLQHWKADCAARVLSVFEAAYPRDARVRAMIQAAHIEADGKVLDDGLSRIIADAKNAHDKAWADGNLRAAQAASAAFAAGEKRASWACTDSAVAAVRESATAELEWQYNRLVEWFTGDGPGPLEMSQ